MVTYKLAMLKFGVQFSDGALFFGGNMGKEIWIKSDNINELDKLMQLKNLKSYNEVISYLISVYYIG